MKVPSVILCHSSLSKSLLVSSVAGQALWLALGLWKSILRLVFRTLVVLSVLALDTSRPLGDPPEFLARYGQGDFAVLCPYKVLL